MMAGGMSDRTTLWQGYEHWLFESNPAVQPGMLLMYDNIYRTLEPSRLTLLITSDNAEYLLYRMGDDVSPTGEHYLRVVKINIEGKYRIMVWRSLTNEADRQLSELFPHAQIVVRDLNPAEDASPAMVITKDTADDETLDDSDADVLDALDAPDEVAEDEPLTEKPKRGRRSKKNGE